MRARLPAFGLAFALCACGLPEDLLVISGSVSGADGGDPAGQTVTLYRDLGATDLGCTGFSPWKELTAGPGGAVRLEHLRQETAGRFGLPRCLRLEWSEGDGGRTASLSWLGRPRSTLLPPLLTWFDAPGAIPQVPTEAGNATPPITHYEVSDARGIIFRQVVIADPMLLAAGPGPAPAHGSDLVLRRSQRVQQPQDDALGQDPLVPFEYRLQFTAATIDGNAALAEQAHGSACDVLALGSTACAFTDGLFRPVDLPPGTQSVELQLARRPEVHTVVVRGIGATAPFTAVLVDEGEGSALTGSTAIDAETDLLATGSLEDERPMHWVVVHWSGHAGPVSRLRVRLQNAAGANVPIGWLAELSVY